MWHVAYLRVSCFPAIVWQDCAQHYPHYIDAQSAAEKLRDAFHAAGVKTAVSVRLDEDYENDHQ